MRVIYNGGFLPALAIDDSPESSSWGWLMAKNPLDGQWVTIANLSAQITAQTDDVIDAQIATLTAKLARVREFLRKARHADNCAINIATHSLTWRRPLPTCNCELDEILREVGR